MDGHWENDHNLVAGDSFRQVPRAVGSARTAGQIDSDQFGLSALRGAAFSSSSFLAASAFFSAGAAASFLAFTWPWFFAWSGGLALRTI